MQIPPTQNPQKLYFHLWKLNSNSGQESIVSADFVSVGSAFGTIFLDDIVALSLPDGLSYQTYCLNDTLFQGYYSLSLDNVSEKWFNNFTSAKFEYEIDMLCKSFAKELFHLFEHSLMEQNKTRVSFQLNILEFLQGNVIANMVKFSTTVLTQNYKCLLILFIFLSRKLVDIQVHKHKISITVSSSCKVSITSVDGEVNRIVGWDLFAT